MENSFHAFQKNKAGFTFLSCDLGCCPHVWALTDQCSSLDLVNCVCVDIQMLNSNHGFKGTKCFSEYEWIMSVKSSLKWFVRLNKETGGGIKWQRRTKGLSWRATLWKGGQLACLTQRRPLVSLRGVRMGCALVFTWLWVWTRLFYMVTVMDQCSLRGEPRPHLLTEGMGFASATLKKRVKPEEMI